MKRALCALTMAAATAACSQGQARPATTPSAQQSAPQRPADPFPSTYRPLPSQP